MGNKLTKQTITNILLLESLFKDDDTHLEMVETIAGVLYKHIKPYIYRTYMIIPSIVVNGLADGVYESIHLAITLEDREKDTYNIHTKMDFNKDKTIGFLYKVDKTTF